MKIENFEAYPHVDGVGEDGTRLISVVARVSLPQTGSFAETASRFLQHVGRFDSAVWEQAPSDCALAADKSPTDIVSEAREIPGVKSNTGEIKPATDSAGRSRRRSPEPEGGTPAEPQTEAAPAEEAPARRRRRSAEPAAETAPVENPPETGRRRRAAPAEPAASETTSTNSPADAAPSTRRRRARAEASTSTSADDGSTRETAASPSDEKITDADVSKAASEGARELTPKRVMEILEQFGVASTDKLDQGQRREFIDQINAEIEANS